MKKVICFFILAGSLAASAQKGNVSGKNIAAGESFTLKGKKFTGVSEDTSLENKSSSKLMPELTIKNIFSSFYPTQFGPAFKTVKSGGVVYVSMNEDTSAAYRSGGGGGIPTFAEVTAAGAATTVAVSSPAFDVTNPWAPSETVASLGTIGGIIPNAGGSLYLKDVNSSYGVSLYAAGFSNSAFIRLPQYSGILAGTVNGVAADIYGNIPLTGFAPLASPAFTGTPTAPTATVGTNTTQLATTAFVLANAGGSSSMASVSTTAMNAISSPTAGQQVYNTDYEEVFTYSTTWGWQGTSSNYIAHNEIRLLEDFINFDSIGFGVNRLKSNGIITAIAGGGDATSTFSNRVLTTSASQHYAVISWSSGTGLNYNTLYSPTIMVKGSLVAYETRVRLNSLSSATESYVYMTGINEDLNSITTAQKMNAYFIYDSTGVKTGTASRFWQIVTSNISTGRSLFVTSKTVVQGQFINLKCVINPGVNAKYYIDGVLVYTESSFAPNANSSSANGGSWYLSTLQKTATAGVQQLHYVDFMRFQAKISER